MASRSGLRLHEETLRALGVEELARGRRGLRQGVPVGAALDGSCIVEPTEAQRGNLTATAGGDGS